MESDETKTVGLAETRVSNRKEIARAVWYTRDSGFETLESGLLDGS